MLCAQFSDNTDDFTSSVVGESTGDNFKGTGESLVRPLLNAWHVFSFCHQTASQLHLDCTTAGSKSGVENDIASNTESVVQIALNFVEDIFGCTTEEDSASLRFFTFSHESEVVITDFPYFEESAVSADIAFLELFGSVSNGSTA